MIRTPEFWEYLCSLMITHAIDSNPKSKLRVCGWSGGVEE